MELHRLLEKILRNFDSRLFFFFLGKISQEFRFPGVTFVVTSRQIVIAASVAQQFL